jgi:hypothetical protein
VTSAYAGWRHSLTARTVQRDHAEHEGRAAMPSASGERYDFFLSRRGSVLLLRRRSPIFSRRRTIRSSFRTTIFRLLRTSSSRCTRLSERKGPRCAVHARLRAVALHSNGVHIEANAAQSTEHRRMVILRCEDAPLVGLFAPHVYQDLVGIGDAEEP